MTLFGKDWRGERGLSVNALQGRLAKAQTDIDAQEAAKAAIEEALAKTKAEANRIVLEALLGLFEVAEAPEMVMMPIGRDGWDRATRQTMLFHQPRTADRMECELPLHGLDVLLASPLRWAPDNVISLQDVLGPVFHPEGYTGYKEYGFVMVRKALVRERVSDQWLAEPNAKHLPYLRDIAGNIPFIRAFSETTHERPQKWGVFFPENRPAPDTAHRKMRYEHGWDFDSRARAEAFAMSLVKLVETTPADEVLALPGSSIKVPTGIPLRFLFSCTTPVTWPTRNG